MRNSGFVWLDSNYIFTKRGSMSKGSTQRPTDKEAFDRNFDRIFGTKESVTKVTEVCEQDQKERREDFPEFNNG